MIIWGSRSVSSVVEQRQFYCPRCAASRPCQVKQAKRFFTLYFIPIIPLDDLGRYVECAVCHGTFTEEALKRDPEKDRQEVYTHLLRVMVLAALADGEVDDAEATAIKEQYLGVSGWPIPDATLESEITMARSANATLNGYAARLTPESMQLKAIAVKLAYSVMAAGGELKSGHERELADLGHTLAIPELQYQEMLALLRAPAQSQAS